MYDLNDFTKFKRGKPGSQKLGIEQSVAVENEHLRIAKVAGDFVGDRLRVDVFCNPDENLVALRFGATGTYAVSRRRGVPAVFGGTSLAYTVREIVGKDPVARIVDDSTILLSRWEIMSE
jgi:hypothetical protein